MIVWMSNSRIKIPFARREQWLGKQQKKERDQLDALSLGKR
jgi:hypothetical protein